MPAGDGLAITREGCAMRIRLIVPGDMRLVDVVAMAAARGMRVVATLRGLVMVPA